MVACSHRPLVYLAFLLVPLVATAARAQPRPGDEMIDKYLARKTAEVSQRVLDGATTLAEWQARRPRLRQEYLDMLGLWPLPEKAPLHATVTGTLGHGDVVIEKLHYQSRPGLYVTGNLYRPRKAAGKLPAVLYVCGHSGRGRDGNKTAFQDHGLWFAHNGYVCLVIDTLQLGEVPGIHHGTYREGRWWWQARGYTPAGVECWNGIRGLDYLVSRPEVDATRLAVTGISGGGAATFWIAAADERVRCAVPVSGMSDLESYVTNKVINGHCDCMFLVNTYGWEWTTIAALVAPRPLLFCNSDNDRIFPMDGNRRIIARLRRLYKLYDKPDLVDDYVSEGGHDYRPDLRIAAFKWINKHLKNDTGPVKDADFKLLAGKELRVFPEDKDVPKDAVNGKIDETFVPRANVRLPEEGKFAAWKAGLLRDLRARSFRTFPERIPPAAAGKEGARGSAFRVTAEPGIEVEVVRVGDERGDAVTGTVLVPNAGEWGDGPEEWAKPYLGKGRVAVVLTRGVGPTAWTRKDPPNYVERAHALLGQTVDQGRARDIAAVVRFLDAEAEGKRSWRVVGRGQAGILAAYAALFEPAIKEVVVIDPPASHRQGPIFLNVLRVLDVPEALGLLAPRPLTLVHATGSAFDRTAQIYKLAGAESKLRRK
jgi:cephalosporin-C deacetylase-like acetyl esterase